MKRIRSTHFLLPFDNMQNTVSRNSTQRPQLVLPAQGPLLLHTCCAPCSADIITTLHTSGIDFTVFFYNPNIHPQQEYVIRKEENKRFADLLGVSFIDADYDSDDWMQRVKGLENEPERGKRCTVCFNMRLERTALYAHEHAYPVMATSLGISRWKDMKQVYTCAQQAASRYDDILFWDYNWRKQGGSQRMIDLSKREHFYQQEYCGCVYSLRDANIRRQEKGLKPIQIGQKCYGNQD